MRMAWRQDSTQKQQFLVLRDGKQEPRNMTEHFIIIRISPWRKIASVLA
jgi:hypothetical protein